MITLNKDIFLNGDVYKIIKIKDYYYILMNHIKLTYKFKDIVKAYNKIKAISLEPLNDND